MRTNKIKQLLFIVIFMFFSQSVSAEESSLILYDSATEIGVVGRKEYLNEKGEHYKIEFFRTSEFKVKGSFDKSKLILYQTEYKYFNRAGQEIVQIRLDVDGSVEMLRITEYMSNNEVSRKWFDQSGRMYQLDEFKKGKWTTSTFQK